MSLLLVDHTFTSRACGKCCCCASDEHAPGEHSGKEFLSNDMHECHTSLFLHSAYVRRWQRGGDDSRLVVYLAMLHLHRDSCKTCACGYGSKTSFFRIHRKNR